MTGRHFEYGNLQLASRNSQLSLSLSSSFTLALPPLDTELVTADDISHLSRTGQLWIAKANPCRLAAVVSSSEGMDLDTGAIRSCIDSIIDCPLWAELGLSLRLEADQLLDITGPSTQTSLIINHPDLSSEFLAPPATPYAGFQTLACTFKFHTRKLRRAATTPVERPRQSIPYNLRDNAPSYNSHSASHLDEVSLRPGHTRISSGPGIHPGPCLGPGTAAILANQARDNTSLECPRPLTDLSCKEIPPTNPGGTHDPEDWIADIPVLVSAALYRLIGVKKAMQGVRTTKNITSVPLIDIAPAVWNLRYLQSFASRVELLPAIASTLAGLSQAQSPAIRAKIRGLLTNSSPGGEDDRVYASIYQRLSLLVHLGLDVEPVSKPKNKNTTTSTTTGETGSTRLSLTMTGPEVSQPLTQQTDVSDETLSMQLDLFGESMHSVTTWDSRPPASALAKDGNIEADKYTLTTPGETQLTMGMSSQDGVVVDEQGCTLPSELAEDDYEYVYAIVPVPEGAEGGRDGGEESWFPTQLDNQAGSFVQEPRDWGAWNTFPFPRHGGTLTDDEMQPRSQGPYGAGVNCGSGILSSAYFAEERTDIPLDECEGQSMYISLNCPSSRGTI